MLLEVLRFGDRGEHRLTKLERVGRRFHLIVENFIADAPFLRLDFELHRKLVFVFCNKLTFLVFLAPGFLC